MTQDVWWYPQTSEVSRKMKPAVHRAATWGAWKFCGEITRYPPEGLRPAPATWHTPDGRSIEGFPVHREPWAVWIADGHAYPAGLPAGAAYPPRPGEPDTCITILVYDGDDETTLTLRLIHELLHTMNLPADDMDEHIDDFLFLPERSIYRAARRSRLWAPLARNWFEALYYRYLLREVND